MMLATPDADANADANAVAVDECCCWDVAADRRPTELVAEEMGFLRLPRNLCTQLSAGNQISEN